MRKLHRATTAGLAALLLLTGQTQAAPTPASDSGDVAARTFLLGCVAYAGDYAKLRDHLRPGQDMYLPELSPTDAVPFLQGREGTVWARPDAGVTLALLKPDETCVVFVRKVSTEALFRRLETGLRSSLSKSFTVRTAGEETKGAMRSRFIDLIPSGSYREDLIKLYTTEPAGMRVVLTTSETANPNLQAIITLGTRSP
ncbi:NMCC_0638 family (lipo)protein [Magnetospirillum molischianum]|uniref:Uncharacterized protein n=1 Tax=Magnetospirillum molischianum DSM 120 TaxID=1150626 RepID=H8FT49_MAGML|nr:hypothetical protein [Magnetospirillum molischianum]CCG41537.1 conserved exported hypothetical protein [Magnetospirillum molischianum DSM 120]